MGNHLGSSCVWRIISVSRGGDASHQIDDEHRDVVLCGDLILVHLVSPAERPRIIPSMEITGPSSLPTLSCNSDFPLDPVAVPAGNRCANQHTSINRARRTFGHIALASCTQNEKNYTSQRSPHPTPCLPYMFDKIRYNTRTCTHSTHNFVGSNRFICAFRYHLRSMCVGATWRNKCEGKENTGSATTGPTAHKMKATDLQITLVRKHC